MTFQFLQALWCSDMAFPKRHVMWCMLRQLLEHLEGKGKGKQDDWYPTPHTTSCRHAVGIHLGSIWDPLDSYIIILGSSMTRFPPFSNERKNHGLCRTGDQLPLDVLSGNTSNWIQNSCSRRGVGAEELLTRPRPRYSWAKAHMLLSIAVAGWSGGLRGGRETRKLCAKLRRLPQVFRK